MSRSEIYFGKKKSARIKGVGTAEGKLKEWSEKLLDFFPAEVVALYTMLWGIAVLAKDEINFDIIAWIIFGVGVLGVIVWLRGVDKIKNWSQIFWAVIAYVAWVFTISSPFTTLSWYHEVYGSLILVIVVFFLPIFAHKK